MEANEIICPQCGLANNELAESCVQCGIIFIKNPGMSTHTVQDDRKIKAIEEAESLLNDIPATPEIGAFENDIIKGPDPHEDTAEMPIPKEEAGEIKSEASGPEAPESKADKNSDNQEIEMEALEATMETVDGTMDPEALFLSKDNPDKSIETATAKTDTNTDETPAKAKEAGDQNGEILELKTVKDDGRSPDALPVIPVEENPIAGPRKEEKREKKEPAGTQNETAEGSEAETAIAEVVEPEKSEDLSIPADAAAPSKQEVNNEKKLESTAEEAAETKVKAPSFGNATIEMPAEWEETNTRADELSENAKQDALKKQQEAQAKAEALEKEKVARAAALQKKKRVQVQALKKQKAAQAKAEALKKKKQALAKARALKKHEATRAKADALKKQKDAQAMAEASSQDVECACTGMPRAGMSHYELLLGLLKRYKGKAIGINYDNSSDIREAELVDANEEFFSVRVKEKKLQYSYPLKTILTIVEGQEGVEAGEGTKKAKFDAVIKVYPLVLS